jgi:hypothetical protein
MEETSEGVLEEMEEITSSVKPSGPSSSSEELTMLFDEDAFHRNILRLILLKMMTYPWKMNL